MDALQSEYPWTKAPLIVGAPMRLIALAPMATEISAAGGLGFVGAGNDASNLGSELEKVSKLRAKTSNLKDITQVLPVGVGFLVWAGEQLLQDALPHLAEYCPAAVWLFAPRRLEELSHWASEIRRVTRSASKIWVQVGTVREAAEVVKSCRPDVIVVQGQDAGGHGLQDSAGLVTLLPEVVDAVMRLCTTQDIRKPSLLAAGGIMDGRGAAAALALGASGVVLGTRYLASPEANVQQGYKDAVLEAADGGAATARSKLYDTLRGTTKWPDRYGGRGVLNDSYFDATRGMSLEENKRLYDEALTKGDEGWGMKARLTTYAGTGVGLVKSVRGAAAITEEVREDGKTILRRFSRL